MSGARVDKVLVGACAFFEPHFQISFAPPKNTPNDFGHTLLWPRPTLATTYLATVHRLWHGQLWAFFEVRRGRGGVGAREWEGGARWGAQTQKKGGGKKGGARRVGGPKFRVFFFPSPAPIFILFFSLRVSSRVFFPLSGFLLVDFWWCFGRSGPQMCLFSPLGCPVKPRRPAVPQDSLKAKTSTFEVPTDQNTTKIPREDPQRGRKNENCGGKEKREILGGPTEGGPKRGGSVGQNRAGHQKSARPWPKIGQGKVAKVGPNWFRLTKNGPNRPVKGCHQNRKSQWPKSAWPWPKQGRGQTRSWPNKVVAKQGRGQTRS